MSLSDKMKNYAPHTASINRAAKGETEEKNVIRGIILERMFFKKYFI